MDIVRRKEYPQD